MSIRYSSYNPEIPARLISCLNDSGARYEILHEPSGPSGSGRRPAAPAGLIGTAVVRAGKQRVLAGIASQYNVDLKRFARLTGEPVSFEAAGDFKLLCPAFASGANHPVGTL